MVTITSTAPTWEMGAPESLTAEDIAYLKELPVKTGQVLNVENGR